MTVDRHTEPDAEELAGSVRPAHDPAQPGTGLDAPGGHTEPDSPLCALCEVLPKDGDDALCVTCRIEVTEASEVVHDPVVLVLNSHQRVLTDEFVLCLCDESFDAPDPYRRHVATLVYEALGLPGPIPNTPASDEITDA